MIFASYLTRDERAKRKKFQQLANIYFFSIGHRYESERSNCCAFVEPTHLRRRPSRRNDNDKLSATGDIFPRARRKALVTKRRKMKAHRETEARATGSPAESEPAGAYRGRAVCGRRFPLGASHSSRAHREEVSAVPPPGGETRRQENLENSAQRRKGASERGRVWKHIRKRTK